VQQNGQLAVSIANSTPLKKQEHETPGIGLNNLRRQLELLYPGRYRLQTEQREDCFDLELYIQLESKAL
jgi:two-component system, LytTR family, sensor kinase